LTRYYDWLPAITPEQCEALGLHEDVSWSLHGQSITIYQRGGSRHSTDVPVTYR